jgi:hypothetical protein
MKQGSWMPKVAAQDEQDQTHKKKRQQIQTEMLKSLNKIPYK